MYNSPTREKASPQKNRAEEKEAQQKTLSDYDRVIKEAQERLGQKKREFDFISKLDKKQVSKYVLGADHEILAHTLKREAPGSPEKRFPSPEQKLLSPEQKFPSLERNLYTPDYRTTSAVQLGKENEPKTANWMSLPDRKPNIQELNKYMEKIKDDFYEPISKNRIKELHEQLKKGRDKFSLANIRDDDEKVAKKYHENYSALLRDQLRQEAERRRRNKFLIEMHEMRLILNQKVNINEPKIWKKEPLEAGEAKRVREAFEEKLKSFEDKSLQYSINYETDISKKVEVYLNSKYKDINVEKEINVILKEKEKEQTLSQKQSIVKT